MSKRKNFIVDTSVIIDNPFNLIKLSKKGKNKIFITEVVIEELDKHKTSINDLVAIPAREFFRNFNDSAYKKSKEKTRKKKDKIYEVEFNIDNEKVIIYVISRIKYLQKTLLSKSLNDEKIREVAKNYGLIAITNDISFKFKAMTMGIKSESIHWDSIENLEDINFKFNENIVEEDSNEKFLVEKYRKWSQLCVNYIDKDTKELNGKRKYFIVGDNKLIDISNNDYSRYEVKPLNMEQKFLIHMLESDFKIMTISGKTGSGKTLLSLQEGMRRVRDKNSKIDGIVYMRFTVNAEDKFSSLGYRKGSDEQKTDRFNYPMYNAINLILDQRMGKVNTNEKQSVISIKKNELTEKFLKDYNIEFLDIASSRGITLKRKYIIFDEIQNAPNLFLKLIGTRVGEDSVLVLAGDPGQVDHPHLSEKRNGLITMLKATVEDKDKYPCAIKLERTVRSETAKWYDSHIDS